MEKKIRVRKTFPTRILKNKGVVINAEIRRGYEKLHSIKLGKLFPTKPVIKQIPNYIDNSLSSEYLRKLTNLLKKKNVSNYAKQRKLLSSIDHKESQLIDIDKNLFLTLQNNESVNSLDVRLTDIINSDRSHNSNKDQEDNTKKIFKYNMISKNSDLKINKSEFIRDYRNLKLLMLNKESKSDNTVVSDDSDIGNFEIDLPNFSKKMEKYKQKQFTNVSSTILNTDGNLIEKKRKFHGIIDKMNYLRRFNSKILPLEKINMNIKRHEKQKISMKGSKVNLLEDVKNRRLSDMKLMKEIHEKYVFLPKVTHKMSKFKVNVFNLNDDD